jgi:uncharacterized protein
LVTRQDGDVDSVNNSSTAGFVAAGDFDTWLERFSASLHSGIDNAVPCGDCRGCCTSGHFISVGAEEREALAAIPAKFHVRAPGLPLESRIVGFDADGSCPMLRAGDCSIYQHRPKACRKFDCRVLAAADLLEEGRWSERINSRVRAWKFTYRSAQSEQRHRAIAAAASFITSNASLFPGGRIPRRPLDIAALAVKVHEIFTADSARKPPGQFAAEIVDRSRQFDRKSSS